MTKKYYAHAWSWGEKIQKVEIQGETNGMVTLDNGMRRKKLSKDDGYFDSFDAAKTFLLRIAEKQVESARAHLQAKQDFLGNVKGLKDDQA